MIRGNQSAPIYSGFLPHSPYLKRPSPTGSLVSKLSCYEHENYRRETIFCCCYTCPEKHRGTSLLATIGICCLVLLYTIFGGFVFMALEGELRQDSVLGTSKSAQSEDSLVGVLRTQTVERLWSITENLNILYKENWTKLAAEEVLVFQESLFKVLHDYEGNLNHIGYHQGHKWSFSSSFLYSLTLITTIGEYLECFQFTESNIFRRECVSIRSVLNGNITDCTEKAKAIAVDLLNGRNDNHF
ncbi:hypothetical protein WA026_011864 [Henosepilachna vigintioctopunctata]|uniref:Uncharacterized protein n=1 Tax=Henosepilachna vigintioctopunctata TaxID=420089 RepID=A0AAW1UJD3_9CUCU